MHFANGSVSENYIHFLPSLRCCMTMISFVRQEIPGNIIENCKIL